MVFALNLSNMREIGLNVYMKKFKKGEYSAKKSFFPQPATKLFFTFRRGKLSKFALFWEKIAKICKLRG